MESAGECGNLESDVGLCHKLVVVAVARGVLVANEVVLDLEEEVLVESEIGADGIDALEGAPSALVAEGVVGNEGLEPLGAGYAKHGVPTVGTGCAFPGLRGGVPVGNLMPGVVGVFGACSPSLCVVAGREGPAVASHGDIVAPEVSLPSGDAEEEAFEGLHLEGADEVLAPVVVGVVDTVPVEDAGGVGEESMLVLADGEEATLESQTDVAPVHVGLSAVVAKAGELGHDLVVAGGADVPGVQGIAEGERSLELSELHGKLLPVRPLDVEVADGGRVAQFHLEAVLEVVEDAAGHVGTGKATVETIATVRSPLVVVAVFPGDPTSEDGC